MIVQDAQFDRRLWVTTSWDDGYPLDLRLAELLDQYHIPGTFYVPIRSQLAVLTPAQIRQLARRFDVGGHTVTHVRLNRVSAAQGHEEIFGSKQRIQEITGVPCRMFCPPGGQYRRSHVDHVREAGYLGMRTVELMSTNHPVVDRNLVLLPTTLQLFSHNSATYLKNAVKRQRWGNLKTYFRHAFRSDLNTTLDSMVESLLDSGGMLHIWGHSWEIEHSNLWGTLERILKTLSVHRDRCRFFSNSDICEQLRAPANLALPEPPAGVLESAQVSSTVGPVQH